MTDFGFIDDKPIAVFTLSGIASQPGPDRLLRPISPTQFAALLEAGFAGFFDEFARRLVAGQSRLLDGLESEETADLISLFQPLASLPGVGQGYLQVPANRFADGAITVRGEPRLIALYFVGGETVGVQGLEIELESGSLVVRILGGLIGTGALTAALLFLAQPDYSYLRQDMLWNQRVEQILDGQVCALDLGAKVDINELRRLAINDLRITDRDLAPPERHRRVCYAQLLLRTAGAYPGKIDGIDGPQTRQAKQEFAKKVGLHGRDIDTPVFYDALIDSVQRKI